ncbi:MAG: hypothetical protein ACRER7_05065, partial [Gammaproteobacteria bacterium]
ISMVHLALPLTLADAHTGVAALLLATAVALNWAVWARPVFYQAARDSLIRSSGRSGKVVLDRSAKPECEALRNTP